MGSPLNSYYFNYSCAVANIIGTKEENDARTYASSGDEGKSKYQNATEAVHKPLEYSKSLFIYRY